MSLVAKRVSDTDNASERAHSELRLYQGPVDSPSQKRKSSSYLLNSYRAWAARRKLMAMDVGDALELLLTRAMYPQAGAMIRQALMRSDATVNSLHAYLEPVQDVDAKLIASALIINELGKGSKRKRYESHKFNCAANLDKFIDEEQPKFSLQNYRVITVSQRLASNAIEVVKKLTLIQILLITLLLIQATSLYFIWQNRHKAQHIYIPSRRSRRIY